MLSWLALKLLFDGRRSAFRVARRGHTPEAALEVAASVV